MKIKLKGTKRTVSLFILSVVSVMLIAFATDWLAGTIKLLNALTKQTVIITKKNQVDYNIKKKLLQQAKVSDAEKQALRFEIYKHKIANRICLKYKCWGQAQTCTFMTNDNILDVLGFCNKYYPIVDKNRIHEGIDLFLIMPAICFAESDFNPNIKPHKNENGSWDYGIISFNTQCLELLKLLPPELKKRDWKTDVETQICLKYLWINKRISQNRAWLDYGGKHYFGNRGWDFYAELKAVK